MDGSVKQIDVLRHELKALRFMLDHCYEGRLAAGELPAREDFLAAQSRRIYDAIVSAPSRAAAEQSLTELELEEVDIGSFLRLSGEHYYSYPGLVKQRAAAVRDGRLKVESA